MTTSSVWRHRNMGKKKARPAYKPKIRWELLGLSSPNHNELTTSIETIRKGVASLASQGFEPGTSSRLTEQRGKGRGRNRQLGGTPIRRRGATE